MPNRKPNKGRRLRLALGRFSAMLMEECRDLLGLSYPEIDSALDYPKGRAYIWSKFGGPTNTTGNKKERSPQAGSMQTLENKVAKLLGRPAHKLVIESNSEIDPTDFQSDLVVAELGSGVNVRKFDLSDLQIGYEDDWPTYRRLKYAPDPNLIHLYRWQWKVLWDPEIRKEWGDERVEKTIQEWFERVKHDRETIKIISRHIAGSLQDP